MVKFSMILAVELYCPPGESEICMNGLAVSVMCVTLDLITNTVLFSSKYMREIIEYCSVILLVMAVSG